MLTYKSFLQDENDNDIVFNDAVKLVSETGKASASLFQRHLKLGYARAARLLDQLETAGIISPGSGAKPRDILIPYDAVKGVYVLPPPRPKPIEFEQTLAKWKKTKYADIKSNDFEIELGVDEKNKPVSFNLEKYGNLLIIGSQFTSAVDLLNNILATSMAKYSPEELKIEVIDGIRGDLIVPSQASHLMQPVLVDFEKVIYFLKWLRCEVEHRAKMENTNYHKILVLINSFNQLLMYSPLEIEDNIYALITCCRKYGIYFVIGTDYPNPKTAKQITANIPAKLVFRPTDKKIARETGIPESIDLMSPDEAILETMFEDKKKITINKVNVNKIYDEIFE